MLRLLTAARKSDSQALGRMRILRAWQFPPLRIAHLARMDERQPVYQVLSRVSEAALIALGRRRIEAWPPERSIRNGSPVSMWNRAMGETRRNAACNRKRKANEKGPLNGPIETSGRTRAYPYIVRVLPLAILAANC